ncbi:Asp23/Gls24 family envelope stress response protein [Sinosporangium siamense]|uniref:Asp23/Gls24 family envelope stress response protein n=1 Tax=Sinosporangium siamense TaxID=1367973 RepID=A0A919RIT4_9ACTN|nr:Asp23/Gls24 family envelope stress response protein [Sinosporangium siamense]GII92649.1 hypothetical protein Ssi02_28800 [Sinosporangium siamense]
MTVESVPPAIAAHEPRGVTIVPERVVSRIAGYAAMEVAGVGRARRRGSSPRGTASASVDGDVTAVQLNLTVEYPMPIRQVAENVRLHVAERVHTLTGLTVAHIDVDVPGLVPARREEVA